MKGLVIVLNNLGGNFMKQNENILLSTATVKLLTMKELHSVRFMDVVSDFYVEQWLEENTDYAWGIFKNETDELMGYCTIGYADDTSDIIEKHPEHTDDSLLLSDVYIKPQFRNKGYGIKLITEVIRKRWELDGNKNAVLTTVIQRLSGTKKMHGMKHYQASKRELKP